MTHKRSLALAIAIVAASTVASRAQTLPWPSDRPQAPGQAPWPTNAPPPAPAMAPGPAGPPMGMGQPMQPMQPMGQSMGPPAMNAAQQECLHKFTELRQDVEKHALAAKGGADKHVSREEMCKLVTAYSGAEAKWLKYSDDNMTRCGIPKDAIEQIRGVHLRTADARKRVCAAGPQAGPAAPPTLSEALGTMKLPSQETEKRKPGGGTLDTLTGNSFSR